MGIDHSVLINRLLHWTSAEYTSGEETILDSPGGSCDGYKRGEDDLQTFDFISKLKLDFLETHYAGVTRVRGSNRMQTAYRLEKETDITLPTKYDSSIYVWRILRIIFRRPARWLRRLYKDLCMLFVRNILPNGLPEEFSAVCTFRARKLPKYTWHIVRIVDMENEPQFLIAMNPKSQTLDFSMKSQNGELQTVSFPADRVSKMQFLQHCNRFWWKLGLLEEVSYYTCILTFFELLILFFIYYLLYYLFNIILIPVMLF